MDDCGGVGMYTVESVSQFELLNECAAKRNITIPVLLRVTSGNQFGLDEAEVERLVSHRENYPNIDIHGIQCYTGTQKKKIDHITKELEWLDGICDMLKKNMVLMQGNLNMDRDFLFHILAKMLSIIRMIC